MELLKKLLSKITWDALGGRRFALCLGAGVVTSILCYLGKVDSTIYRDVVLGTVGVYVAGNVTQKVKARTA